MAAAQVRAETAEVRIRGSDLVVSTAGRLLSRSETLGAVLTIAGANGSEVDVRIDGIVAEGDVILYELSVVREDGTSAVLCPNAEDDTRHAIFQLGPSKEIRIFCTADVGGKCIRLGYRPWAAFKGVPLAPYWEACTKMLRADYCGDDRPTTVEGMLISMYDALGINPRSAGPDLPFEAAWDADGALCVHHPRVPQNITLQNIAATCPRLSGRLGHDCTEAAARRLGTPLFYNGSLGDGISRPPR